LVKKAWITRAGISWKKIIENLESAGPMQDPGDQYFAAQWILQQIHTVKSGFAAAQ
jgi:hypothetical protein